MNLVVVWKSEQVIFRDLQTTSQEMDCGSALLLRFPSSQGRGISSLIYKGWAVKMGAVGSELEKQSCEASVMSLEKNSPRIWWRGRATLSREEKPCFLRELCCSSLLGRCTFVTRYILSLSVALFFPVGLAKVSVELQFNPEDFWYLQGGSQRLQRCCCRQWSGGVVQQH